MTWYSMKHCDLNIYLSDNELLITLAGKQHFGSYFADHVRS